MRLLLLLLSLATPLVSCVAADTTDDTRVATEDTVVSAAAIRTAAVSTAVDVDTPKAREALLLRLLLLRRQRI